MRNDLIVTAICWETRNARRNRQATECCRNYGLKPLTNSFWIGKLKPRERRELQRWFQKTLQRTTEKFHLLLLCELCYENATLHRTDKNLSYPQYEIIG